MPGHLYGQYPKAAGIVYAAGKTGQCAVPDDRFRIRDGSGHEIIRRTETFGGCLVQDFLPLGGGRILWCATEMNSRESMDLAAQTVKEVLKQ